VGVYRAVGRNNQRALRRMSIFKSRRIRRSITRPIRWINTLIYEVMKRRIRPIRHTLDQPVFDRIDMNIIQMRPEIRLITNQVFPIPALPNARSPRFTRTFEHSSVSGNALEQFILISRQRNEKLASRAAIR
jgi:hypothetical protein